MDSKYDVKRAGLNKFSSFAIGKSYKPLHLLRKGLKKQLTKNGADTPQNGSVLLKTPLAIPVPKAALIDESNKKSLAQQRRHLPVSKFRDRIIKEIVKNECLVLLGETGSGKTTQIPQFVYESGLILKDGMCAVTQPRRMAAISIAQRVAEEQQGKLGDLVGYVVRFEDATSNKTKIQYMTDGSLLRQALNDRLLERYSVIILDEAHERTINTDVLFGLAKAAQAMRREEGKPPLRIIVMSATMDVDHFAKYFNNCSVIYLEGRLFPVQVLHAKKNHANLDYQEICLYTLFNIHTTAALSDDVLVFLTGQEEIESMVATIKDILKNDQFKGYPMKVLPLYAQLAPNKQLDVFKKTPQGVRKVILATNIAETSITISGIKFVIDSGVVKQKTFNPGNRVESLKVAKISQAQAWQRTGRAGRESAGTCYRVYPIAEFNKMPRMNLPEILHSNLGATVLQLLALNIDCATFDFMDKPSAELVDNAFQLLVDMRAIDGVRTRRLTEVGAKMAKFPLEPRLSRCLLASVELGCLEDVLTIVALLSADNIFVHSSDQQDKQAAKHRQFRSGHGDLITLLNVYKAFKAHADTKLFCFTNFLSRRNLDYATKVRNQLEETCRKCKLSPANNNSKEAFSPPPPTTTTTNRDAEYVNVRKCLLSGFYDNVARLQKDNTYMTLSTHQRAKIHPSSGLSGKERPELLFYTEFLSTGQNYLKQNTVVEASWLADVLKHHIQNK